MNGRIELAVAMGWSRNRVATIAVMGRPISHQRWFNPQGEDTPDLPDPFTDANDDYAVLEWMRSTDEQVDKFKDELNFRFFDYRLGSYATAALKVLEDAA